MPLQKKGQKNAGEGRRQAESTERRRVRSTWTQDCELTLHKILGWVNVQTYHAKYFCAQNELSRAHEIHSRSTHLTVHNTYLRTKLQINHAKKLRGMYIWLCKIYLVRSTYTPVCGQNVGLGVRAHRIANWLCTLSAQTPLWHWQTSEPSPLCNSLKSFDPYDNMWTITLNLQFCKASGDGMVRREFEKLRGWAMHS